MNIQIVMKLAADALVLGLKLAGPFLLAGLVVGLIVSIIQAATQLQEFTLQFIPKIAVTILVLALAGPWMLENLIAYTHELIQNIPQVVKGQ